MAALQCEVCGGKLVGKPGGVFECNSCGMEYSTEWAKAKMQEIQGTVKNGGIVHTEGIAAVKGGPNLTSLLRRGDLALADGAFGEAITCFDQTLNIDAECIHAYLGLMLARCGTRTKESFETAYIRGELPANVRDFSRIKQLGDASLNAWIDSMVGKRDFLEKGQRMREEQERSQTLALLEEKRKQASLASHYIVTGRTSTVGLMANGRVLSNNNPGSNMIGKWCDIVAVDCDGEGAVGLRANGTAWLAVGKDFERMRTVSSWRDIVAVAGGGFIAIGLKADGTVVAIGSNLYGACNVEGWRNIAAVVCSSRRTIGLKADGTVVATGENNYQQCDVESWRDIVAVACGNYHTVGLKADGTVMAAGDTDYDGYSGQCDVESWRDIVAVACGDYYTVGLKADGTVVAVGNNYHGECNVQKWRDIVAVACGGYHTIGLKADGTVVATGGFDEDYHQECDLRKWRDIVAVVCGDHHTVGLKADGTVMAAYQHSSGVMKDWKLFNSLPAPEQGLELKREAANLFDELSGLKGLFTGKRRNEIYARRAQIQEELRKL